MSMLVFEDEQRLITLDRAGETGELRWHAVESASARAGVGAVPLVVHAYRENIDGEETIRIISARRAGPNDLRRYQEQEME